MSTRNASSKQPKREKTEFERAMASFERALDKIVPFFASADLNEVECVASAFLSLGQTGANELFEQLRKTTDPDRQTAIISIMAKLAEHDGHYVIEALDAFLGQVLEPSTRTAASEAWEIARSEILVREKMRTATAVVKRLPSSPATIYAVMSMLFAPDPPTKPSRGNRKARERS